MIGCAAGIVSKLGKGAVWLRRQAAKEVREHPAETAAVAAAAGVMFAVAFAPRRQPTSTSAGATPNFEQKI